MKNPLRYDYMIDKKRISLFEKMKQTKEVQSSFEIYSIGSGFRFYFPILKENKFLGQLSITFEEQAFTAAIMKQYDVVSNMILDASLFNKEFLKSTNLYQKAHLKGFLHNKAVVEEIKKIKNKTIAKIKPNINTTKELYKMGMEKKPDSYFIEDKKTIVTIIPILHSITNTNQGFISILSTGRTIGLLNDNYLTIATLFLLLYAALILLFVQQKIKSILDKEKIEEITKKDKQILEQAKLAQMGEMIANIAHQWRQPLSAISTIASGLKLNYEYNMLNQDDIPKQMDLIVDNTKYLSKTIDTFRGFIKEEKALKEIVIQERLDDCLNIINASIINNHIKLINKIDYKNPVKIKMVSGELSQVIINLINNSKDAIVQNNISNGWIKIVQKEDKENVIISIKDNGGGIKNEIIDKIFDPYFTTKHQYQGTGLGLYMSKIIIEKHLNGTIEVSNTKYGASFTIKLKKII